MAARERVRTSNLKPCFSKPSGCARSWSLSDAADSSPAISKVNRVSNKGEGNAAGSNSKDRTANKGSNWVRANRLDSRGNNKAGSRLVDSNRAKAANNRAASNRVANKLAEAVSKVVARVMAATGDLAAAVRSFTEIGEAELTGIPLLRSATIRTPYAISIGYKARCETIRTCCASFATSATYFQGSIRVAILTECRAI